MRRQSLTLAATAGIWASAAIGQPAPSVQVTGMVAHPGPVALNSLSQATVNATFSVNHGAGKETGRWTGPLLLDVLKIASITDAPGKKTHLRHVIFAAGADSYTVAVAIGEIEPKAEGKQVIVAITENGKPLTAPRLVVPGDVMFSRGVRDLVSLAVQ